MKCARVIEIGVVLAHDLHESAERKRVHRILRLPDAFAEETRREADAELGHFHARKLRDDKMPVLVPYDEDDEHHDEYEDAHGRSTRRKRRQVRLCRELLLFLLRYLLEVRVRVVDDLLHLSLDAALVVFAEIAFLQFCDRFRAR